MQKAGKKPKKSTQPIKGLKFDEKKIRYDLLDEEMAEGVARILTFGAEKYGPNNWQGLEDFEDRYYAALKRHIAAWRKGEMLDPESGLHHLFHAACNIYFLLWRDDYGYEKKGD